MNQLITMDQEKAVKLVETLPAEQRSTYSKAFQAAANFANKTLRDYDKALELTLTMVKNEWHLGHHLNRLFDAGEMGKHHGNQHGTRNISRPKYADFGISDKHGLLVRRVANQLPCDGAVSLMAARADHDRRILPKFWQLKGVVESPGSVNTPPLPKGVYRTIVIDPPWPLRKTQSELTPDEQSMEYATLSVEEIANLPLPCADDCHVFLWTTQRFLPYAFQILQAWDLKYSFSLTWHKPHGRQMWGLPQFNSEIAVYARRGSPQFVTTKAFKTCFDAPRGGHSEKPEEFYEMIRRVSPGPRLDMFNRREIDGFDGWGAEAPDQLR